MINIDNSFKTPGDFLSNSSFLEYCMGQDPEVVTFWDNWIEDHPDQSAAAMEAKRIFAFMGGHTEGVENEVIKFKKLLDEYIKHEDLSGSEILYDKPTRGALRLLKNWTSAAAVIIICTGLFIWSRYSNRSMKSGEAREVAKKGVKDISPGYARAKLQMGNGTIIDLDSLQSGSLKDTDGTEISKNNDRLIYSNGGKYGDNVIFNTLTTPRGGEYQVVLPDGSKVWLNAASSLRFPLKFTENFRTVYLTGEAYFEVTKDPHKPFHVQISNGLSIEVLGTQFNVMDYDDEAAVKATLLEGRVKMSYTDKAFDIIPDEQVVFNRISKAMSVKKADVDKEIAWKTGHFEFSEDDLPSVLRQFSRWYDVEVAYSGEMTDKHYTGSVSRRLTLLQALEILRLAGIQYSIENNKLLIKKI